MRGQIFRFGQALVDIHTSVKVPPEISAQIFENMEGLLQQTCYGQDVNLSALAQCYFILGEPEEVGFSGSLVS